MKKRILSGMRPTGPLHIGHLLGALKNWVRLQDEYESLFMIADWHALMSEYQNPKVIRENIYSMISGWLSCGLDPAKSTIFVQSQVPEHLELAMILSCITPLSWLERCPTYKEQLREMKTRDLTTYGFLGYPILQAADILVYKADTVPVGEDQLAHLELTREITRRFNKLYKNILVEPKPLLTKTARILGLDNRKMSKSYANYIALSDSPDTITKKVATMITDAKRIKRSDRGNPKVCNVYSYYNIFKPVAAEKEVRAWCIGAKKGCTACKEEFAGAIIDALADIRKKHNAFMEDKDKIQRILDDGNERARKIASGVLKEVKRAVGMA